MSMTRHGVRAARRPRVVGATVAILAGCAAGCMHSTATPADMEKGPLASLVQDGRTTRGQAAEQLGKPQCKLEGGRVAIYRLGHGGQGNLQAMPRDVREAPGPKDFPLDQYSLVLVFDSAGMLTRHSVVPLFP